jgi:hypothetical protein
MACIPTPDQLDDAPELAVLAVLEHALDAAANAVVAMHPELRSGCPLDDELPKNPAVWVAYELTDRARTLRDAIRRYRVAVTIPCPRCPSCNALAKGF